MSPYVQICLLQGCCHWINPTWIQYNLNSILTLIASAKSLFPSKVHSEVPGGMNVRGAHDPMPCTHHDDTSVGADLASGLCCLLCLFSLFILNTTPRDRCYYEHSHFIERVFPGGSDGKESACKAGDLVQSLGQEDPLEKGMAVFPPLLLLLLLLLNNYSVILNTSSSYYYYYY